MPDSNHNLSFCVFLVLLALLCLQSLLLQRSMKRTVYAYRNIVLIGGILFTTVLLAVYANSWMELSRQRVITAEELLHEIVSFPRTFSYYAVCVILVLCALLGISNVSLIRHEGFCLQNALSLLVAGLYVGGTAVAYQVADHLIPDVFTPLGLENHPVFLILGTVLPLFLLLMMCYFECVLIASGILGWIAARQVPDYDRDYIVILGCSIDKRGGLLPLLKGRVNRAIRFAWEQEIASGKPLKYVPSGGQGPNEIISEGSAMALYLMSHGAEEDEVLPEKASRNTLENFQFSKRVMEDRMDAPKVAFATTNYHILRSGILARKAGLDAQGIAGDTKWYFWPNGFIREFFGILVLERGAHVLAAAVIALLCLAVGCVEYAGIAAM